MVVNNTTLGKEVYKNEKVAAGSMNLKFADFTGIEELTDDDDYTITVIGNTFDNYVQNKSATCNVVSEEVDLTSSSLNSHSTKVSRNSISTSARPKR